MSETSVLSIKSKLSLYICCLEILLAGAIKEHLELQWNDYRKLQLIPSNDPRHTALKIRQMCLKCENQPRAATLTQPMVWQWWFLLQFCLVLLVEIITHLSFIVNQSSRRPIMWAWGAASVIQQQAQILFPSITQKSHSVFIRENCNEAGRYKYWFPSDMITG